MATEMAIHCKVCKGWLFFAVLFERIAKFCDERAVILHDGKGKKLERTR